MAVLIEAISVVVRRERIDKLFPGGWDGFVSAVPNRTLCADDEIVRVGFMTPQDTLAFIDRLIRGGLKFLDGGRAIDLAVIDQQGGATGECAWLEFGKLPFGDSGGEISVCWFFDGPRIAAGLHMHGTSLKVATPPGWEYEGSISQTAGFVPTGDKEKNLRFLRVEDGADVFLDLATGKAIVVGRSS
jgi:hypothetical protein